SALQRYEYSMRERNRLLTGRPDPAWLEAVEQKMAEAAIAVAAARNASLDHILPFLEGDTFPLPEIGLVGEVEEGLRSLPALEVEERLRQQLRQGRGLD